MPLTRRGLLAGILVSGFAPAFVGSGVLMPLRSIAGARATWTTWIELGEDEPLYYEGTVIFASGEFRDITRQWSAGEVQKIWANGKLIWQRT